MTYHIALAIDDDTQYCECCGRTHMHRTIKLTIDNESEINLGVICVGRWFKLNMTGNIYQAIMRLASKINHASERDLKDVIARILEEKAHTEHEEHYEEYI